MVRGGPLEIFWLLLSRCSDRRLWAGFCRVLNLFLDTELSGTKIRKLWKIRIRTVISPPKGRPLEEGSKLKISPVQATQIEPQDAHWLRMDPSLTRAVLAKTEEDLLGGLAALMRNKVEHEQVSRRLAQVQIDTAQAKHELDAIQQQIRRAEEEVATRINEQNRINEEITERP